MGLWEQPQNLNHFPRKYTEKRAQVPGGSPCLWLLLCLLGSCSRRAAMLGTGKPATGVSHPKSDRSDGIHSRQVAIGAGHVVGWAPVWRAVKERLGVPWGCEQEAVGCLWLTRDMENPLDHHPGATVPGMPVGHQWAPGGHGQGMHAQLRQAATVLVRPTGQVPASICSIKPGAPHTGEQPESPIPRGWTNRAEFSQRG